MKQELGHAIKAARIAKGLTQEQLAEQLGIGKPNISRYESGIHVPEMDRLVSMANVLGVKVSALMLAAEQENNSLTGQAIKGTVPLISWVQAGQWEEGVDHLQPGDGERIATTYRVKAHTYALKVRGDSMEPKFPDGCVLIVEPEEEPINGSYVIVRQNGGDATFKQLVIDGDVRYLRPLNPRYPIMGMHPSAVFCGVVKKWEMEV